MHSLDYVVAEPNTEPEPFAHIGEGDQGKVAVQLGIGQALIPFPGHRGGQSFFVPPFVKSFDQPGSEIQLQEQLVGEYYLLVTLRNSQSSTVPL